MGTCLYSIGFISRTAPRTFPFIKGNDRGADLEMNEVNADRIPMLRQLNANVMPIEWQLNTNWLSMEEQLTTMWVSIDCQWNVNSLTIECQLTDNWLPSDSQLESHFVGPCLYSTEFISRQVPRSFPFLKGNDWGADPEMNSFNSRSCKWTAN